ncbi:bcl-2-like protein 1 [Scomber scombrus]|uniref:Bcl-2-like protein 1 n=1 Tax=Scomber scombrus TaxID=13677 RepID=A0AAV1NFV2_SCOSC|nr:bcl-2-like protein 1 [Scomber scombrus]
MPYSNRELVEFFISHKLSQKNYPTSLLKPEDASGKTERDKTTTVASNGSLLTSRNGSRQPRTSSSPHGDIEAVKAALRDSADKFELLFTEAFSDLSSQIDITPETAYHSFKSVMDEVFKDGVNWGRVVGLFTFGGAICVKCVERNMSDLVSRIVDWMTIYLDEHINPWIQSQGGWDCFVELFGREAAAAGTTSRDSLRRCLLAGAVLLMGVLVGVLIAKKQ